VKALAFAAYDRCFYPAGTGRQLHAITSAGDRTEGLRRLRIPAAVIHGSDDPLVRPAGGRATAKAIPGSALTLIEGMGHDLPPGVWPRVIDAISRNAARSPVTDTP
jgi:pimeloyl-ACP methyl ester carboxylesterase